MGSRGYVVPVGHPPQRSYRLALWSAPGKLAYVVSSGSGRALLEGEVLELKQRDVLRVVPEVVRSFEAGPDGLELVAIGGPSQRVAMACLEARNGLSSALGFVWVLTR